MSVEHVNCVTVACDRCNEQAPLYEDMGTAHYESVEQARKQLVDDNADEPDFQWSIDGDAWYCPSCTGARACEVAGGHNWGDWDGVSGGSRWEFRACRRPACNASERRPTEGTAS